VTAKLPSMSSTGGQTNNASNNSSNSLSSMISTFVPAAILALAFVTAFIIARKYFRRVYAPRTYLDHLGKQRQTPAPSGGLFGWIKDFKNLKDEYILDHQSIDGYLYVRFFKVLVGDFARRIVSSPPPSSCCRDPVRSTLSPCLRSCAVRGRQRGSGPCAHKQSCGIWMNIEDGYLPAHAYGFW